MGNSSDWNFDLTTAPKDGTRVLLLRRNRRVDSEHPYGISTARWKSGNWYCGRVFPDAIRFPHGVPVCCNGDDVLAWMPAPAIPANLPKLVGSKDA